MDKRAENILFNLKNQDLIIQMKRATKSFHKSLLIDAKTNEPINIKSENKEDNEDIVYRKIVPSVYNYIDVTGEVIADNCFKKSIKENATNVLHIKNHKLDDIAYRVGNTKSIEEVEMNWTDFGIEKDGGTQVLLAESEIMRVYNSEMFLRYKTNIQQAHSIGFFPMKVMLAADDESYKDNFELYKKMLPLLGNPEIGEALGMFFVIKEGRLVEFSALDGEKPANTLSKTIDPTKKSFYSYLAK
jgi:hypothetical protein